MLLSAVDPPAATMVPVYRRPRSFDETADTRTVMKPCVSPVASVRNTLPTGSFATRTVMPCFCATRSLSPTCASGGSPKVLRQQLATQAAAKHHGVEMFSLRHHIVQMASALASVPDLPDRWRDGQAVDASIVQVRWQDKAAAGLATMALVKRRLRAIAAGRRPQRCYSPVYSLVIDQIRTRKLTRRYRQWNGSTAGDRP